MALLSVNGISKQERGTYTLKDIHFTQQPLQKIAVAGETGSGKTTLLKIIAGLVQPDAGKVLFNKQRVLGPFEKLIPGHPGIAYLSQYFELRNNYFVHEELEAKNLLTAEAAGNIYAVCRVQHLLNRRTDQLSGGERQRIVLARLLTTLPQLLVLDEPFSNADAAHKKIIKSVIEDIGTRLRVSCILVSHDAADLLPWADQIIVLKSGEIIQQGTPLQVYQQPVDEYCAGLFGEYNLVGAITATTFFSISPVESGGKQLLIRPGQFQIEKNGLQKSNGIVQFVLYRGSYFTVGVRVGEQLMHVNTISNQCTAGDNVHLSLAVADRWYV
jgi:ABC-type sulfate/molybdate transport systems ATPase subunit